MTPTMLWEGMLFFVRMESENLSEPEKVRKNCEYQQISKHLQLCPHPIAQHWGCVKVNVESTAGRD